MNNTVTFMSAFRQITTDQNVTNKSKNVIQDYKNGVHEK